MQVTPAPRLERLPNSPSFVRPPFHADTYGYVEEEYILEGEAALFRLTEGSAFTPDGAWQTERYEQVPYCTRFIVRRPKSRERFNGSVIVIWNNVTAGFDNIRTHPYMYEAGFVIVGASVQRVGLEGFACANPQGLKVFDPERYGRLTIPTDDASYDIFTQIARAVGRERSAAVDPLDGLDVKYVIAKGGSQSAERLSSYINAVAPHSHPFSGFILDVRFGDHSPIETPRETALPAGIDALATLIDGTEASGTCRLRDIGVPIFVINTETEARSHAAVRQPDTRHYRLWEAAGLSHAGGITASAAFRETDLPPNWIDIQPLRDVALFHMQRWIREGIVPPTQPLIALEPSIAGNPPRIARDEEGIAIGGLRLPPIEAPLATHTGFNTPGLAFLRGSSLMWSVEKLRSRYGSRTAYMAALERSAERAVNEEILLPQGAETLVRAEMERCALRD